MMPKDCSCFMQMIDYNSTGLVQIFTKTGINNGLWMPYKCTKFQLGLDHSTDSSMGSATDLHSGGRRFESSQ